MPCRTDCAVLRGGIGGRRGRVAADWARGAGVGWKVEVLDPMAICLYNVL